MRTKWFILLIICLVIAPLLLFKENLYRIKITEKPIGYYNLKYTGPLKFVLKDDIVAWIKSPEISSDVSFNSIPQIKQFTSEFTDKLIESTRTYNIDYDIIWLVNKIGLPDSNPISQNRYANSSQTIDGERLGEDFFKNIRQN